MGLGSSDAIPHLLHTFVAMLALFDIC